MVKLTLKAVEDVTPKTTMASKDPKQIHQQSPYSGKKQPPPGSEKEMRPKPTMERKVTRAQGDSMVASL